MPDATNPGAPTAPTGRCLTAEQMEQGLLLKRLEQLRATMARIEAQVGPYRPARPVAAGAARGFLPAAKQIVTELEQAADRILRAVGPYE